MEHLVRMHSVGHLAKHLERPFHLVQSVQLEMMQMARWDMDTAMFHSHFDLAMVAVALALASALASAFALPEMAVALAKLLQIVVVGPKLPCLD